MNPSASTVPPGQPDLADRTALVTGGGAGIGAAIARALAAAGAKVTVVDIDDAAAHEVADDIGGTPWTLDLTDVDTLAGLHLSSDILVNNAGIQHVSPIEEFPPEKFRLIVTLMLEAPFLLVRAALPYMYEHGFGRIINISSVHGLVASPFKSAYVAAKHGLEGLSKTIALEGGGRGVTSVCLNPAYVRTSLVERQVADQARTHGIAEDEVTERIFLAETAVKRMVTPDEVGAWATFLAGPNGAMANGSSFSLDGGWTAR